MIQSSKAALLLFLGAAACAGQEFHKWTFDGGVGPTFPVGTAKDRWNTGWNFALGGGYNFNSHLSGLLELQYDHFNLSDAALISFNQPYGYTKFWTITVNPRYDFNPKGRIGAYATGGYGLYARTLTFTDPSQAVSYCDPYYGYCDTTGAPVIASFTNYKGGVDIGGGVTYALGGTGLKVFTDVRYNRYLSHSNNDFITLRFGIRY